jgi:hypothetical protein
MEYYRQCSLQKKIPKGTLNQVSWIPESFAILGKYLKLLEDDIFPYGWQVVNVGGRQSRNERLDRQRDYKRQRKGSDMERGTRGIGDKKQTS